MQKFFSTSQRSALKLAHKIECDRKISDCMKAVLLADQNESLADWFKRNAFSFKKSEPAPVKADAQAQLEFIDTYRTLKDNLSEGEVFLFLDAMHPTIATKAREKS